MRLALLILAAGSGCYAAVTDDPAVALRAEPATVVLDVDLAAASPPVAPLRVFAIDDRGSERDVTADVQFAFDGPALGTIAGGLVTSDGLTGGHATLHASLGDVSTAIDASAYVHARRIDPAISAARADAFAAATAVPYAAHVDPADGALVPAALGALTVSFAADDTDDTHLVRAGAPYLDLEIVAPGVAGPRALALTAQEWAAIARTAAGGEVVLDVESLASSAPASARVARSTLAIVGDVAPNTLLVSGALGTVITDGSPVRPSLWRYDMHAGATVAMFDNPTGACIGCHLAASADGSRIAALAVAPETQGAINGIVFDRDGAVLGRSNPAATAPWATAAFDPSGALVAAWQGSLSLRDETGAMAGAVAMDEAAAAPTIAPDGRALAYVELDAGFGDAASQPIGNALHVRPWDAASGAVGATVELAREATGIVLPAFSADGRWIAYGVGTPDTTRLNEVPMGSWAVRADGSGTKYPLTADPADQLAHFASPIAPARIAGRAAEPMVWVAIVSKRAVGGDGAPAQQVWLEAFFPERGVLAPAFHLPGQPAQLQVLHGPIVLN